MFLAKSFFFASVASLLYLAQAVAVPAPRMKHPGIDPRYVGRWKATFSNGVVETCEVRDDGHASESETLRSSEGKAIQQGEAIVITFADDRVERWTAIDKRMVVEHWCPAASYPHGNKVVGIADRVRPTP